MHRDLSFDDFLKDYENDIFLWDDLEGLLVDFMNEQLGKSGCNTLFRFNDVCLYVEAYIPSTKAALSGSLSQEEIQEILSRYVQPLLEKPLNVQWLIINI